MYFCLRETLFCKNFALISANVKYILPNFVALHSDAHTYNSCCSNRIAPSTLAWNFWSKKWPEKGEERAQSSFCAAQKAPDRVFDPVQLLLRALLPAPCVHVRHVCSPLNYLSVSCKKQTNRN